MAQLSTIIADMGIFRRKKDQSDDQTSGSPIGSPPSPAALSNPDFVADVQVVVSQVNSDGHALTYEGDHLSTDRDEPLFGAIRLENLAVYWDNKPQPERRPWLESAIVGLLNARNGQSPELSQLRPGIRARWAYESTALRIQAAGGDPDGVDIVSRPICGDMSDSTSGDLVQALLIDSPTTMQSLSREGLTSLGLSEDQAYYVALDNLAAERPCGWTQIGQGVWAPTEQDDYTATRFLLPGYVEQTGIEGELVAFLPARNAMLIASATDSDAIALAAKIAEDMAQRNAPLSAQPLIGRGQNWRPLNLPVDHVAYESVMSRIINQGLVEHSEQKDLLDQIEELTFIATYSARKVGAEYQTYCTWSEGVIALLPRTEQVAFISEEAMQDEADILMAPWDEVMSVMGDAMEQANYYPPRWKVSTFPNREQWTSLD